MKTKQSKPASYFDVPAMNTTAIASQFKQICTEVADAIREKKGSTDKIRPKDFSSEIRNISGGGGNSRYAPRYFKIDWSKASEDWKLVLTHTEINGTPNDGLIIGSTFKPILKDNSKLMIIQAYPFMEILSNVEYLFSYLPTYFPEVAANSFGYHKFGIFAFEDALELVSYIITNLFEYPIALSMEGITEITEEEFYNFNPNEQ